MEPFISVIIPVYNVEKYLSKCLDSVLAQTYRNLEIIVVDDGSPDKCPEICDKYAEMDSRVIVIHKNNGGQSSARNAALDIAKGEYITFVDSDDYIAPDFIEKLFRRIKKDNSDIAVCNYNIISLEGKKIVRKQIHAEPVINVKQFCELESNREYMFAIAFWNKLFKAEIWDNIRLIKGKYAEDSFAMTEYIKIINKISVINEPLYNYVKREGSAVNTFSVKNLDAVEARLDRCDYYCKCGYFDNVKGSLFQCLDILSRALINLDMSEDTVGRLYNKLYSHYRKLYSNVYKDKEFNRRWFCCTLYYYSDFAYKNYVVIRKAIRGTIKNALVKAGLKNS